MSENVDRIIDDQIKQRPGARHAYQHDPMMHNDIERARSMLTVMEAAMQREGIPHDSAERVLNEIVSTGLDGWERDKRSRERMLLLAEPGPGVVRDPELIAAWLQKEQARLREATGFDLSDDAVPTSGEEKNA
jgi:hypothetical protein